LNFVIHKELSLMYQKWENMNALEVKNKIETETGLKVSVKRGNGSMAGYLIFTTKRSQSFEYLYSRNFIKQFPSCDFKPSFANNYQISIYHGIEA